MTYTNTSLGMLECWDHVCLMTSLRPCSFWFSWARCSVMSHNKAKRAMNIPELKKTFEDFTSPQPPYFCMVQHISMLWAHLLQEQLKLTMIQATCSNEVHCFHDIVTVVQPTVPMVMHFNSLLLTSPPHQKCHVLLWSHALQQHPTAPTSHL